MDASPPRRRSRPPSPPSEATVSSLPPEILEKVVSLLPLRESVRTSAVSRAWRRLWESAPGLDFDWGYGADPAVVDAVLARYSLPVRSFWFHLRAECFWRADGWVPLLAGKGVQALRLHFSRGRDVDTYNMDASIFSCRELTRLDLTGCDIPAAPLGLAGFPNLTRLYLHSYMGLDSRTPGLGDWRRWSLSRHCLRFYGSMTCGFRGKGTMTIMSMKNGSFGHPISRTRVFVQRTIMGGRSQSFRQLRKWRSVSTATLLTVILCSFSQRWPQLGNSVSRCR